MPQVDIVLFLPIISFLFWVCIFFFGFVFLYLLFPFVSGIKVSYNFLSKVRQFREILSVFF